MDIVIDLTRFQAVSDNPILFIREVFVSGGWVYIAALLLLASGMLWYEQFIKSNQRKYLKGLKYIMLALDIPKGNEQTPKALESLFSHLHGIQRGGLWKDRVLGGYLQAPISLEILGMEGEIQFLIRVPADARDIVEASVYAQYPEAAISEVRDYTELIPDDWETAGYDLWGTEIVPYNNQVYPIRTYPFFEHQQTQQFLDPLASLLELISRLGPTENVWLQWVITPADDKWKAGAKKEIKKLLGDTPPPPELFGGIPQKVARDAFGTVVASVFTLGEPPEAKKKEKTQFSALTTGEKGVIEAIQVKASKIGWNTRFRFIYIAKAENMTRSRGIAGVLGALKQFNTQDMNGFKPDAGTKTGLDHWFVKRRVRQRKFDILRNYKSRMFYKQFIKRGPKPYILNVEELASLYHFPVITVKAPQMQKTEARKAQPPIKLPTEPTFDGAGLGAPPQPPAARPLPSAPTAPTGGAPTNLPT